ncbi:hypothetical protein SISSUDRAFT_960908, partial [Sistotremastrum suecicum HHB10207 ss-3]
DFALISGGGRVWWEATSPSSQISVTSRSWLRSPFSGFSAQPLYSNPEWALHPQSNLGTCWGQAGPEGYLGIHLMSTITVSGVTIDHPMEVRVNTASTPREMLLLGVVEDDKQSRSVQRFYESHHDHHIFEHWNVQTFSVIPEVQRLSLAIKRIVLVTISNWGNPNHTLICRVRIHGDRI